MGYLSKHYNIRVYGIVHFYKKHVSPCIVAYISITWFIKISKRLTPKVSRLMDRPSFSKELYNYANMYIPKGKQKKIA